MLDKNRILSKIDELDTYTNELKQIMPNNFSEYQKIEKRRSCERLIQLCIECIMDVCKLFVAGLRLGLPSGEEDLFVKMLNNNIISPKTTKRLKKIRGFRNILIHEYAEIDNRIVFDALKTNLNDLAKIKNEILAYLKCHKEEK